ncbi:hypothetical protein FHS18_005747 [Paenibacillus phyllosphaerae]|uniref:GT-D fold-like domain-containing protein n=1 Tax=Paenibacillus phyllosphaerae TaxID=274593 RepID=A0A7W5B3R4_9BACL|nr:hypothetical protein [Paenibacillus phyllosphaerae]
MRKKRKRPAVKSPRSKKTKRTYRQRRVKPAAPVDEHSLPSAKEQSLSEQEIERAGYEKGLYEGGEMLLEQSVPPHMLLPEVQLTEIIAAGVHAYAPQMHPLLDVAAVYEELSQAIDQSRPYAVVRLGDGELLALAQDVVYDSETLQREARFLSYAGVTPPDLAARDQLAMAIRQAQVVGLPRSRQKHFQPLMYPVLRQHGIELGSLRKTSSTINYELHHSGLLAPLLRDRRLLIIGNAAPECAHALQQAGYSVTGIISPVNGFRDIDRIMEQAHQAQFDFALVAAGIPAVILCWRIAAELGKPALDFGHMADAVASGKVQL